MKRILFLCLLAGLLMPLTAQDIKVRNIKKLSLEGEVSDYAFGKKSHRIQLIGNGGESLGEYNTRTRRVKPLEKSAQLAASAEEKMHTVARARGRSIEVTRPGMDPDIIVPAGKYLYIWISVSPDGSKLLFKAVGKGAFVSDLEGNILYELGTLNAPSWMNDHWVLGMNDEDDGHHITASDVFAHHLYSGVKKELSEGTDEIALYPIASEKMDRIVFRNAKGEVFTMKIRIKE